MATDKKTRASRASSTRRAASSPAETPATAADGKSTGGKPVGERSPHRPGEDAAAEAARLAAEDALLARLAVDHGYRIDDVRREADRHSMRFHHSRGEVTLTPVRMLLLSVPRDSKIARRADADAKHARGRALRAAGVKKRARVQAAARRTSRTAPDGST